MAESQLDLSYVFTRLFKNWIKQIWYFISQLNLKFLFLKLWIRLTWLFEHLTLLNLIYTNFEIWIQQ